MKNKIYTLLILSLFLQVVKGQEYQWSVPVNGYISPETNANPEAFLWIPPDCQQLRGLIIGQHNMCEEPISEHAAFRQTMSELGFAILWISPGINQQWDLKDGCQKVLDEAIAALAETSGYSELKYIPIVPLGHSAMATFPWNFAAWNPKRTLAIISYHGDAPRTNLTGYGRENLEWGRDRNIDGIPGLVIQGEYEWWEARVNPALAFRMMYPQSCISFLADVGHGHFDVSDQVVDYICLFLRKAAQYRLPKKQAIDKPAELIALNPQRGWLAERWYPDQKKRAPIAAFGQYKGDPHDAFWYFDQEMAAATERYYSNGNSKQQQFIGFTWKNRLLPFDPASHAQYQAVIEPEADGLTYRLSARFTDSTRSHVLDRQGKGKIHINRICGPIHKINDSTFKVQFYRMGMNNSKRTNDIWLMASSPGDRTFKSSVQQLNLKIDYPLLVGKRQHILFPGLSDVNVGASPISLQASTDAGLPVAYYVKAGPATIQGDRLKLTAIPPRAKYPIKVSVTAWQYGQKGTIQSAEPVERYFYIHQQK
ncbi:hypothetical protein [Sphingobacterium thalpophilum]|uniref:hypothetical protein n=1 Tax=Sphingobacterium thalpophilum TaxID=259 RepID=UPI003C7070FC